jgi:hypothetical protein
LRSQRAPRFFIVTRTAAGVWPGSPDRSAEAPRR